MRAKAAQDRDGWMSLLPAVCRSNWTLFSLGLAGAVPPTFRITAAEAAECLRHGSLPNEPGTVFSFSSMTTGDALLHFARKNPGSAACALNFANGDHAGGGYLGGAAGQEEDLCRQFPTLYTSLRRAQDRAQLHPFGPRAGRSEEYADVLYTADIRALRSSAEEGYRLLEPAERVQNLALVTAAAPDLGHGERFDAALLEQAIRTILVAPKLQEQRGKGPQVDTIILGAWGCGAFRGDPGKMAELFANVLHREGLGRLYREVHFAIPGGNANAQAFCEVLVRAGVKLAAAL